MSSWSPRRRTTRSATATCWTCRSSWAGARGGPLAPRPHEQPAPRHHSLLPRLSKPPDMQGGLEGCQPSPCRGHHTPLWVTGRWLARVGGWQGRGGATHGSSCLAFPLMLPAPREPCKSLGSPCLCGRGPRWYLVEHMGLPRGHSSQLRCHPSPDSQAPSWAPQSPPPRPSAAPRPPPPRPRCPWAPLWLAWPLQERRLSAWRR